MHLVLFCGGDHIYGDGLPKPLYRSSSGDSLLSIYSSTSVYVNSETVTLLVENRSKAAFSKDVTRLGKSKPLSLVVCPDGSTTLEKLLVYLRNESSPEGPTIFSYPDIFYFGDINVLDSVDLDKSIVLTSRSAVSRFPRLYVEPYGTAVRSISAQNKNVRTNNVLMFGGHLIAKPSFLEHYLESRQEAILSRGGKLEVEGFSSFIGDGVAKHIELRGKWMQVDGPRDLAELAQALEETTEPN
jgi:hypothetical protein